ncbi:tetratricopeptide repeat protein [Candidatus Woesearchaeota archaeon]|nr:tetratricopeptide repeat protein [Candidatus Woesearchaeota archaeon]
MADNPFTGLELRAELLDYVKPDGSYNLAEIELVLKQRIKDLTKQYHADKVEKGKHEEIQRAIATAKDALRDLPKPELEAYIAKLLEGDTGLVETAMGELAKSQEERNLLQKDLNEANKFLARAIDETLTPEEKRRYAGGANPEEIKKLQQQLREALHSKSDLTGRIKKAEEEKKKYESRVSVAETEARKYQREVETMRSSLDQLEAAKGELEQKAISYKIAYEVAIKDVQAAATELIEKQEEKIRTLEDTVMRAVTAANKLVEKKERALQQEYKTKDEILKREYEEKTTTLKKEAEVQEARRERVYKERLAAVKFDLTSQRILERIKEYRKTRNLERALQYCNLLLEANENVHAAYYAGTIAREQGNKELAGMYFSKALKIVPTHKDSQSRLDEIRKEYCAEIIAARDNKQHGKALGLCESLLRIDPNNNDARYFAGTVYMAQKEYERARVMFEQLPKHSSAQAQLAKIRTITAPKK